ncbi:hypothetical protein ACF0H5_002162 [Mactra antiquata]
MELIEKKRLSVCLLLAYVILSTAENRNLDDDNHIVMETFDEHTHSHLKQDKSNSTFFFEHAVKSLDRLNLDLTTHNFKNLFQRMNASLKNSADCTSDVFLMINSFTKGTQPYSSIAFKYLDAATKIPTGVEQGRWNWIGDYQECQDIPSIENPLTKKYFKGQYFSTAIYVDGVPVFNPYPLMMGICLPDSCSDSDANNVVSGMMSYIKSEIAKAIPSIANKTIYANGTISDKPRKFDAGARGMLIVTSLIGLVVLVSTVIDYFTTCSKVTEEESPMKEDDEYSEAGTADNTGLLSGELFSPTIQTSRCGGRNTYFLKVVQAFSIFSNGKKLFSTNTAIGPLACLNGIRVMSMWWVILGHSYAFLIALLDNAVYAVKFIQRFTFQPIMNGTFSVDSFFFLSGLLVAYLALNEIQQKGKLNWVYFVVHRYWRLTPVYLYVILYFAFIMAYTSTGPMSFLTSQGPYRDSMDVCKTYWWTNILYINNMYPYYGNLGTTCLGWGWYLANDMQFYLVFGPMLVILLSKKRWVGIGTAVFFIIAGVCVRVFLVLYYGLHGSQGQPTKHTDDPWGQNGALYGRPYARWSVYIVGMLTGYILSVTKNRIKINKFIAMFCWCCAIATALAVIYGQYYYNHHPNTKMTMTASVFYVSLSRTAWSLCLAWVVLACVSGNGGPVKDILSWKIWAPLGRLTYCAYLVHPIVIYTFYFNMYETIHATDLLLIYFFIGHLVISYAVAFVVSMLVEAPMIQLEKLLLKPVGAIGARIMNGLSTLFGRFKRQSE